MVAWLSTLRSDWSRFRAGIRAPSRLPPGMHTYRLLHDRGERRAHLRVDAAGNGTLFIDVTDVVHLNPTATEFCGWALDDVPQSTADRWLRARYAGTDLNAARKDLDRLYRFVGSLRSDPDACVTCLAPSVQRQALFSTPIAAPFKADLALTYECNNDCPHCYNEADRIRLGLLDANRWRAIIDRLHAVGIPHLIFTGGEATLHPDLLDLVQYAEGLGHICGLNSNGRRMSHAEYARQLKQAGLNHLQITLGSHLPDVHDRMMHAKSFQQTVRGIRHAIDAGLHTITNTTLMRMNADSIEETIAFLKELGIRTFAMNGMIYSGGGFSTGQAIPEDEMAPLLLRVRDTARDLGMKFLWYTPTEYCRLSPVELDIGAKRCNAGEYSICVEPNGDVLPCQSYYVAAGNLLRDPWERIWRSELFTSFRDRELDPRASGLEEKCWECPDLPLCGGGCRIEREARAGTRVAEPAGCAGGCHGCSSSKSNAVDAGPGASGSNGTLSNAFVSIDSLRANARARRGTGNFDEPIQEDLQ